MGKNAGQFVSSMTIPAEKYVEEYNQFLHNRMMIRYRLHEGSKSPREMASSLLFSSYTENHIVNRLNIRNNMSEMTRMQIPRFS